MNLVDTVVSGNLFTRDCLFRSRHADGKSALVDARNACFCHVLPLVQVSRSTAWVLDLGFAFHVMITRQGVKPGSADTCTVTARDITWSPGERLMASSRCREAALGNVQAGVFLWYDTVLLSSNVPWSLVTPANEIFPTGSRRSNKRDWNVNFFCYLTVYDVAGT